jgi:hypothetical protein
MKHIALMLAAVLPATQAAAHHSVAGQFDVGKSVHITGVVSRVDWINPHTQLYVDVKQPDGTSVTWKLESLPVAMMRKAGLTRQGLLANSEPVEIDAYPARNGTPNLGYMLVLRFKDGRHIQFNKVPGAEQVTGAIPAQ